MTGHFDFPGGILARFGRDRRGVASILGAFFIFLGLSLSVMVLDAGNLYLTKRHLQAVVDSAALAAAGDPGNASAIVARVVSNAGYTPAPNVVTGAYTANPNLTASLRFNNDPSAQQNAVRVTETVSTKGFLAGIFGGNILSNVSATATAAQTPVVSFAAGTSLATADGGELNAVLGGLLGTSFNLQLASYQALASTNVDALTFLNQLAVQAGVTGGTYGDLANTHVTMGEMLAAASTALNIHPDGNDTAALDALNSLSLSAPSGASATLSQIVNTAIWQNRQIGTIVEQTPGQVSFNLFDLITGMARVNGAGHVIDLGSSMSLAGITGIDTKMAVGSPMASAAAATVGTALNTAQARVAITITAANINLGIVHAQVVLPLYLSVASGTATVAAIPCQSGGTMATIKAAAQAASVSIGQVSDTDLGDFSKNPAIAPATVANVNVPVSIPLIFSGGVAVQLNASATQAVAAGSGANLNFTQADIDAGAVQTAAGSDSGALFSNLISNLTITPVIGNQGSLLSIVTNTVLGIVTSTAEPALATELGTLLTATDPATDTLLKTIGLRLGVMDVVVHGVRCGAPALVT